MPGATAYRSSCPLASALDVVGDKWSLIIIRGFFVGFSRYGDFLKGPEPIATNILADRLQMLECVGLIERTFKNSPRSPYRLTAKGADLLPVLQELSDWGYHHIADRWRPPEWFVKAKSKDFYPKNDPVPVRRRTRKG